jgi:indole-3-glycerol phosphate synthase
MNFLTRIVEEKKAMVGQLRSKIPLPEVQGMAERKGQKKRPFYEIFAGRTSGKTEIIAEIKVASPSRGVLLKSPDIAALAMAYEKGGASALSVITERHHFRGSLWYIAIARTVTLLPVLRKDFIVDEYELYQSKTYGADAALLIGEVLDKEQIRGYLAIAKEINLDILLEVHALSTYEKVMAARDTAASAPRFVLGINNRNLENLEVDLSTARTILEQVDEDQPVVVESGIEARSDVETFLSLGAAGFLVGTSLVLSRDPAGKLRSLRGAL